MCDYTTKPLKTTKTAYTFHKISYKNCTPKLRCNDYKKCPTCFNIWKKKQFAKASNHLNEKVINKFKYKSFLTLVSLDTKINPYEKNSNIDLFLKDILNGTRYKSNIFFESEYFIAKQISFNKDFGVNPHYHIILLSNKQFKRDKKLKEKLKKYNLRIDKKDIYKTKNSYLESIKKLINYSLKLNEDTQEIERTLNLTKNKRYVKTSKLFSIKKLKKSQRNLYKHIHQIKQGINQEYAQAVKQAKALFIQRYNKLKPKGYIRGLKALKSKVSRAETRKNKKLTALKREISKFPYPYTHF